MRIGIPQLVESDGTVRARVAVESSAGEADLWFGVAPEHAGCLTTERADGFLVALLLRAMQLGEDVRSAAPISARLHYHLVHHYQPLLRELMPGLRTVRIFSELADVEPDAAATGVGTGFSAGIDSFAVIHDHLVQPVPAAFRLTHFTFNNVGSHGVRDPGRARQLFRRRHAAIKDYAASLGLPFIAVDSNLSELLPMDFEQTHTTRNLAVALVLQRLFRRFYYASTFRYRDLSVAPAYDSALADPVAVPMLSTESLDIVSAGGQYSRVDKTRLVADLADASRWLNVCASESADGINCSECLKCCRTLFTLELLGRLDQYAGVFNLARWNRVRDRFVVNHLLGAGPVRPLTAEILACAREQGYRFSWRQRASALLLRPVPAPLRRLGRSLRRRLGG